MQYHFVDECGDPGLKTSQGSSSHFVIAMVQLANRDSSQTIRDMQSRLHLPKRFEFKFHRTTPIQRQTFFKFLEHLAFQARIVVIDKENSTFSKNSLAGQPLMINYMSDLALRTADSEIANDILIVDGAVRPFIQRLRIKLSEECRNRNRARLFKKIIGADSRKESGLQIADMIAGATMRFARDGDKSYYKLFEDRVVDLWRIPEEPI